MRRRHAAAAREEQHLSRQGVESSAFWVGLIWPRARVSGSSPSPGPLSKQTTAWGKPGDSRTGVPLRLFRNTEQSEFREKMAQQTKARIKRKKDLAARWGTSRSLSRASPSASHEPAACSYRSYYSSNRGSPYSPPTSLPTTQSLPNPPAPTAP